MAKHAQARSASSSGRRSLQALLEWHEGRQRASLGSPRGWLWMVLIAAVFFWMSNPLVFVPGFHLSLSKAITWTAVAVVLTLPWLRLPRVPWPWIVFHLLCALSALWTIDPHLTEYTNLLYLKITLIALVVAANCEPLVICAGLGVGGTVVVALSIYAFRQEMWGASYLAQVEPDVIVTVLAGVGTNENILAYTLTIALAAMLATGVPRTLLGRAAWLLIAAINTYGLYLAGSGTGFVTVLVMFLVVGAIGIWPSLRTRPRRHLVVGAAGIVGILSLGVTLVVVVLGKDLVSFSGRAPLWRAAWESTIERAPWFGSGWGAVWTHPWSMVPPNEVAQDIADRTGYPLSHGHNFFVDVLPELGLVGVALAVVMVVYAIREVVRSGVRGRDEVQIGGRLVLLVLTAVLVYGVTEPMLTAPLGWWALVLVTATTRQRVRRGRLSRSDSSAR